MGSTLTARVSDELNEALDKISEKEKLEKSAVARRFLEKAVKDYRMDRALEEYSGGEATLRKAADTAGVSLWEFMERVKQEGIKLNYTERDLEEDLQAVKNE
ncbi:MAG: UPF0175 family protein [Candidatus Nanohaloarchaea archaeon]